nr:hypothetical protein [Tanacetum cinerariifolium]
MGAHDDKVRSSRCKYSRQYKTVEEVMLPHVHHPFLLWEGYWNVLNQMSYGEAINEMLTIKLFVAGTNEEIFTFEAWTNAFNIDKPIYSELYHEFYSTYEFDEVCATDELRTKKIIKFRLCGRAFSWTLLEFSKRLGLYNSEEIEEEGFNVYFQDGLPRSLKRKVSGSQKEMIYCRQFIMKISKRNNLLSKEVLNSLSALIYYRALDTTTLRELIDSEGRLIPKALEPGLPRVAIPKPLRASMQDLYERMGSMEIRQERLRGCLIGSISTGIYMLGYLSTWIGFRVFHCKEPITHLDIISNSMTSVISSTHLSSNIS